MNSVLRTLTFRMLSIVLLLFFCDSCGFPDKIKKEKYERRTKKEVKTCVINSLECLKNHDIDNYYKCVASSGRIMDYLKKNVEENIDEIKRAEADTILSYKITDVILENGHKVATVSYRVKYKNGYEWSFTTNWEKGDSGWRKQLLRPAIVGRGY